MGSNDSIIEVYDERYQYYPLDASREGTLLADEHEIVLNTVSGQTTLVDWEHRRIKAECRFDEQELPLIRTLLNDWPSYTPYERLLPLLVTEELAEQLIHCIEEAREREDKIMFDVALQPLRSVLQRCQDRLALFGIQIAAIYRHGYRLIKLSELQQLAQEGPQQQPEGAE
jgi:hypothetical protein